MSKLLLLSAIVLAAIGVILHSSCHAASVSQLDQLKDQFLPAEYKNHSITMDDVKRILREKCKKASGVDNSTIYVDVIRSATQAMACMSTIANITAIQEEIEIARPIGELDTVFHKYCSKAPEAEKCLQDFNTKLQPCLTPEEKKQNAVLLRVATALMGFMCHRGGDQIALFIAEQGPECLEANKEAIGNCLNSSFGEYFPKEGSMPDLFNLPELVLEPKHCIDLERFEQCTLHHLEQCQEITPANIAESVFKFVKNETSCRPIIDAKNSQRSVLKDPRNGSEMQVRISHWTLLVLSALYVVLPKYIL